MLEMVGIESQDDYTLIYHCALNAPYFDTVCTSACMYPISQALIDELGVDNMVGMTNETMWYTGPYFETTFTTERPGSLQRMKIILIRMQSCLIQLPSVW